MTAHYDRMIWCHRLKGEPQEKYVLSNKHKNPIYVTMSSNFNFYSWKSQFVVSIVWTPHRIILCAHLSHFTFQQILILDTDNPNKNKIMIRFKSWFYLLRGETDVQIYVALCKKEIASLPFSLIKRREGMQFVWQSEVGLKSSKSNTSCHDLKNP